MGRHSEAIPENQKTAHGREPRQKSETTFDVVIVGAGINGTAAARELAAARYRILLVEEGDVGCGASSRSSRMLHCGLRYFETATPIRTFAGSPKRLSQALVMAKAAMMAREELVKLAPSRCRPVSETSVNPISLRKINRSHISTTTWRRKNEKHEECP